MVRRCADARLYQTAAEKRLSERGGGARWASPVLTGICDLARSSSGNPPPEHGPVQLHRRFRHFVNPDPAHFRSASVLMAPPTTQGGQSSPPVATLPPPAGPAARRVVCPDHVGCHANRSMRRRIWRNNGPVK